MVIEPAVEAAVHVRSIGISLWPAYAAPALEAALFVNKGRGGRYELVARAVPNLGRHRSFMGSDRTHRGLLGDGSGPCGSLYRWLGLPMDWPGVPRKMRC